MTTPLGNKMRELADEGHPRAGELREKAEAFETVAAGFYAEIQTHTAQQHLGAWARARRLWSECSGEPLL